jgi:hypothetical protein
LGVLIKGTYADEPFLAFVDELADWKVVVINAPKALTLALTIKGLAKQLAN